MHNDVMLLQEIAIDELVANADRWTELPEVPEKGQARAGDEAVRRLEELGLITTDVTGTTARDGVSLTRAGIEALSYLARCS